MYYNALYNMCPYAGSKLKKYVEMCARMLLHREDDNMDIEMETVGGNFLESTALTGQYGHSGKLQAVKPQDADMMDRIKFLAGIVK